MGEGIWEVALEMSETGSILSTEEGEEKEEEGDEEEEEQDHEEEQEEGEVDKCKVYFCHTCKY